MAPDLCGYLKMPPVNNDNLSLAWTEVSYEEYQKLIVGRSDAGPARRVGIAAVDMSEKNNKSNSPADNTIGEENDKV